MDVTAAAAAWAAAGFTVLPVATDGSKAPAVAWKKYQDTPPTPHEQAAWFAPGRTDGLGVLCGAASGHLEMIELEGRAAADGMLAELGRLAHDNGAGPAWDRVAAGYAETTPSGGWHFLYRVDGTARPNTKLARRRGPDTRPEVLVETRGEGGFVVIAPSGGRTHPTGLSWDVVVGDPGTVPTISGDERDLLYAVATMLDRMPAPAPPAAAGGLMAGGKTGTGGTRPGDDYEARTTWDDLLTPRGWTKVRSMGRGHAWRRPGKTIGISATTGQSTDGADRLYVFTTSTEFDAEKPYTRFAAYTHLEHGGDWHAAARALAAAGYGREATRPVLTVLPGGSAPTDGSTALAPQRPPHTAATATLEHSEDGHAVALIDTHGHHIRYCPERGRWLVWDGCRWEWQPRSGGHVREHAKTVARDMPDDDRPAASHKRRSLSAAGTTACLAQAATDPRVVVHAQALDAHPWELNTPGGILDLRTGRLGPPDPTRLHTRSTTCTPDPGADLTAWSRFLTDTFGPDTALTGYLQRLLGYSAVGEVREHILPFGLGTGANGKTVLLETIAGVLGDYATSAPSGFLMATVHAKHETEIARLSGARFVICSEVNEDDRFDEAKVKLLTGGDRLTARFMRDDHFTFTPTHHLWLVGNSQPAVRAGGLSFWRRVRLIKFERTVPEDRRIDDLSTRLATEHGPAVLAWLAAGAAAYAAGGLAEPESVKAATEGYAMDTDTVARFLDDAVRIGGGDLVKTPVAAVRAAYESWCTALGEVPVGTKTFTQALRTRFAIDTTKGSKGVRCYTNATLLADGEVPPGAHQGDGWGVR